MCRVLHLSESGYYRWLRNRGRHSSRQLLAGKVKKILEEHPDNRNYGVDRVCLALEQDGVDVSRRTVYRVMKENGWLHKRRIPHGITKTTTEAQEQETEEAQADEAQTDTVVKTVRATDVVNIRSSDSEEADKIGKAQIGEEFTLLEERGNGWSKIEYNGADAFIKSDYLEVVSEETVEASAETTQEQEAEPDAAQTASGTVKVKESVRIRKSASTDGEVLGTAYAGEEYPLLMKQADGWSKIEYKGQTAYVKSDYVE